MADFDIRDIAALKVKLQIIEKLVLADWILIILSMYYDWGGWITCLIVIQIILYIYKSKLRKQLKQKEYLAKVVEERTIELRILIKDLKENITDQQAIMSKENYADSIEILDMINSNLQKINEHGCNTVRIVKAMEELLKDRHGDVTPTDICNLCKVNVDVIRKQFKEDIENKQIQIELDCPAEPTTAEINIEQMNKVMLNLLKNSLYALLKKLQKKDFTPIINIHVEKRLNGTIFLCIRDNGIGIEDNIKAKIFEPFFTTKPTAEAAGVGLYLCREVILNHQGSIIVKSEKDNFTEFMITIPIYQKSNNNE
mgnify:CR=1 FL=1